MNVLTNVTASGNIIYMYICFDYFFNFCPLSTVISFDLSCAFLFDVSALLLQFPVWCFCTV